MMEAYMGSSGGAGRCVCIEVPVLLLPGRRSLLVACVDHRCILIRTVIHHVKHLQLCLSILLLLLRSHVGPCKYRGVVVIGLLGLSYSGCPALVLVRVVHFFYLISEDLRQCCWPELVWVNQLLPRWLLLPYSIQAPSFPGLIPYSVSLRLTCSILSRTPNISSLFLHDSLLA